MSHYSKYEGDPNYILNPETKRYVKKNGNIGKQILERQLELKRNQQHVRLGQLLGDRQNYNLKKIMDEINQKRRLSLRSLNSTMDPESKYYYPDLDFISHFGDYFLFNDGILCNITPQSQPITLKKEFGRGKVGVAKLIEIYGEPYIMKSVDGVKQQDHLSLRVVDIRKYLTDYKLKPSLMYNTHRITTDGANFRYAFFVALANNFSNQTCMHLILNEILGNMNNYVYQYDAFYCQNSGYNIMDVANAGDLSSYIDKPTTHITGKLLLEILRQVLTPLSILKCKRFGFVHADLKCRNVFVAVDQQSNQPTFKIADFDKSSIYWKGIRFLTMPTEQFEQLNTGFPLHENLDHSHYYYITGTKLSVTLYIMHSFVPMHMSHDVYTFVFSLLREPKVWDYIINAKNDRDLETFMMIVDSLWYDDDLPTIRESLNKLYSDHQKLKAEAQIKKSLESLRSITSINKHLAKLKVKLKYNIDHIYNMLRLSSPSDIDRGIEAPEDYEKFYRVSLDHNEPRICVEPCDNNQCQTNVYSHHGNNFYSDECYQIPMMEMAN